MFILIESTHLGPLVLQLLAELVKTVFILGNAAGIIKVKMSTIQEGVWVPGGRLLLAQVTVSRCLLLV